MARTRNLFISHSWAYGDTYDKLCALLDAAPRFSYRNYSVPKNDPIHNAPSQTALYAAIKNQIIFCEIVIIMAGVYSSYSKWIDKEIQIAKRDFNKPLLAIKPMGNTNVSTIVRDNADMLVNWSTVSVVEAIRKLAP
jgi:hypothetical protein